MLKFEQGARTLRVYVDERLTLFHTGASPFVAVGGTSGGRFFPVHNLSRYAVDERRSTVRFYSGNRSVTFKASDDGGALRLKLTAWSHEFERLIVRFPTRPQEPVFGGGAQNPPNLRGRRVTLWAEAEGVYGGYEHTEVLQNLLFADYKSRGRTPEMFFHDGAHHWFAVATGGKVVCDFTPRDNLVLHLMYMPQEIRMGVADDAGVIMSHAPCRTTATAAPRWSYEGLMVGTSGGSDELLRRLERFIAAGAPVGSVYIHDIAGVATDSSVPFFDLNMSAELYPRLPEILDKLKPRGVRTVAGVSPMCDTGGQLFAEARRLRCLVTLDGTTPHVGEYGGRSLAQVDLTNPAAIELCADMIAKNLLAAGVDGLQCTMTGCLPNDVRLHGKPPDGVHNRWDDLWRRVCLKAFDKAGKQPFLLPPSCDGSGAGFVRGGGQGLKSALGELLSLSLCGHGAVGIDLGAHFASIPPTVRDQTMLRFSELVMFTPLFRIPAQPGLIIDDDTFAGVVRCARLHLALSPYLAELLAEHADGGLPPVRHMATMFPAMKGADRLDGQFMLGERLLVAPIFDPLTDETEVTLPEGDWVRLLDGTVHAGGTKLTVGALVGSPAAFYRKGCAYTELFDSLRL